MEGEEEQVGKSEGLVAADGGFSCLREEGRPAGERGEQGCAGVRGLWWRQEAPWGKWRSGRSAALGAGCRVFSEKRLLPGRLPPGVPGADVE